MKTFRRSVCGVLCLDSGTHRTGHGFLFKFLVPRKELCGLKGAAAGPALTLTFYLERFPPPQALLRASQSQP